MFWYGSETYSAVGSLEHLDLGQSLVLEGLLRNSTGGNETLKGRGSDIPETVMLFLKQDNKTGRLGVERAGNVQDSSINKLLDLSVRDRRILAQLVDGAAVLSRLDESFDRHCVVNRA